MKTKKQLPAKYPKLSGYKEECEKYSWRSQFKMLQKLKISGCISMLATEIEFEFNNE